MWSSVVVKSFVVNSTNDHTTFFGRYFINDGIFMRSLFHWHCAIVISLTTVALCHRYFINDRGIVPSLFSLTMTTLGGRYFIGGSTTVILLILLMTVVYLDS